MDIQAEIIALDAKITDAKAYLKKLRQYKRLLAKVQAEKEAIARAETVQLDLFDTTAIEPEASTAPSYVTVEIEEVSPRAIAQSKETSATVEIEEEATITEALPTSTNIIEFKAKEDSYQSMGIRALRLLCRDRGIKGAARMSKSQCLEVLAA